MWRARRHPIYFSTNFFASYCDGLLVTDKSVERRRPAKLFELDRAHLTYIRGSGDGVPRQCVTTQLPRIGSVLRALRIPRL